MIRKYVIPLLAVAGVLFAVYTVRSENQAKPVAPPVVEPAVSPFPDSVAGSGIIEASTRNIAVGTPVPGVVVEVAVEAGAPVKAGDVLFRLDDRAPRAALGVNRAALAVAEQTLERLRSLPRPEDVPPAEARVKALKAVLEDARTQWNMIEAVTDKRAVAQEDMSRRRFAVEAAEARLAEAESDLAKLHAGTWGPDLHAGTWGPDLAIAQAQVESARSALEASQVELDRLIVRSPVDGQVLQLNVRIGEFAPAGVMATPLVLLGNTDTVHLRVDVDENDAWRIEPGAPARAALRGNSAIYTDNLTFVRIEPYVVPKRSLTGESTERVDTRVLQVIYAMPKGAMNAYVGQLVDVKIKAPPSGPGPAPANQGGNR
jgi:HlyD family secretion protein